MATFEECVLGLIQKQKLACFSKTRFFILYTCISFNQEWKKYHYIRDFK